MTYIMIKCPHCNSYIRQTTRGSYDWGSPFRKCHRCGKAYIDTHYHEVAIEGFSNTDRIRSSWWCLLMPIIISGMLCMAYPIAILITAGLLAIMILGIVNASKKNSKLMEDEMAKSVQRLSNREYAIALSNAGYNVPIRYLVD